MNKNHSNLFAQFYFIFPIQEIPKERLVADLRSGSSLVVPYHDSTGLARLWWYHTMTVLG